ncbi:DNA-methyltransferase [Brucella intermedia]|uniref:DNA-methyltransferase n=1 Tax=Brucella intermedia TaxID=94625 RepID=UPI00224AF57B|nr:site-specific DNA-methyltransferase [Brucella intermedia]
MRVEIFDNITLYNADCRDVAAVYDSVVTDPPYGMAFRSNHRATKHAAIANDGDVGMLQWTCSLPAVHSKYIFCRWDNLADVPKPKSLVTWVKNNWSMGDLKHEHGRQTEVALFYPGPDHYFPNGRPSDVVRAARTGNDEHATQKPVELMEQVLLWTHGVVFDPFMGSGSTLVAAARLGKTGIGVELDSNYFDTACRRVEAGLKQTSMFRAKPANDNFETADMFACQRN